MWNTRATTGKSGGCVPLYCTQKCMRVHEKNSSVLAPVRGRGMLWENVGKNSVFLTFFLSDICQKSFFFDDYDFISEFSFNKTSMSFF